MPDEELFATAADGSLLTPAVYEQQVERLFNDPRRTLRSMVWSDFFEFDQIPDVAQGRQDGPAQGWYHAGSNDPDVNTFPRGNETQNSHYAMQSELRNLGRWFTSTQPGTFEDLFRSNLHFMPCPDEGQCAVTGPWACFSYGIHGPCTSFKDCQDRNWDGTGQGWNGVDPPMELPEPERAGLLTRMSMLAHDTVQARPIQRGLKIRELLLCDPVPPPENCEVVKPPQLTGICESDQGPTGDLQ